MQQRLGKTIKPKVHLYPMQISDDWTKGGNKWAQIKPRIRLDESWNEEQ
jgi:hypothetical protein